MAVDRMPLEHREAGPGAGTRITRSMVEQAAQLRRCRVDDAAHAGLAVSGAAGRLRHRESSGADDLNTTSLGAPVLLLDDLPERSVLVYPV